MAIVAHARLRNTCITTSYGAFTLDSNGHFKVTDEVAAGLCSPKYGGTFSLVKGTGVEVGTAKKPSIPPTQSGVAGQAPAPKPPEKKTEPMKMKPEFTPVETSKKKHVVKKAGKRNK